jgi:hypothetical protein
MTEGPVFINLRAKKVLLAAFPLMKISDSDFQLVVHRNIDIAPSATLLLCYAVLISTTTGGTVMRTLITVTISMVAGIAIGGIAVHCLNAQAKPPAYVIGEIDVADPENYAKEYLSRNQKPIIIDWWRQIPFTR